MRQTFLTVLFLTLLIPLSAAGLFLDAPPSTEILRFGDFAGILRLVFLVLLLGGFVQMTFRFALKRRSHWDQFAFLAVLICAVNFLVQLSGGLRSPWQVLYLIIAGTASMSFPGRLVAPLLAVIAALETSNWIIRPTEGGEDILRLVLLVVASAVVFGFMQRSERQRVEQVEEELQRLNLGLLHLTQAEPDGTTSPLSEEGKKLGRVEYVKELDRRLGDLLKLVRAATEAQGAFLIQSGTSPDSFVVRLFTHEAGEIAGETATVDSGLLEQVLREDRLLSVSEWARALPPLGWYTKQPVLHSLLAIPLRNSSGTSWILVLDHVEPEHFDVRRREVAENIARQMSAWLSSTRQLADLDLLSSEFRRLYEASAGLSQALRVDQILQLILSFCREVSRFETCAICLSDEGEDYFTVPVAAGYPDRVKGATLPLDSPTWAGWLLRAREEPLVIRIQRKSGMPILDRGERATAGASLLGIPLRAKNRVSGVLLMTCRGKEFSPDDVRILRILCNQAAVAIENARVYERLEQLAATDGLTGLFNRRYFEQALERELSRVERGKGSLALLLLDIDHFKQLNDTYGHPKGDVVLKRVAETLRRALRKGDVLARFGGEEFVILLPHATYRGAKDFAERIRKSIDSGSLHPAGPRKRVTASVGWALYPEDGRDPKKLIELADRALYFAKNTGRNRAAGYHLLRAELDS